MPFKSQRQRRLCYALRSRGQNGSWDCDEWQSHTPKKLPEAVKTKKASLRLTAFLEALQPAFSGQELQVLKSVKTALDQGHSLPEALKLTVPALSSSDRFRIAHTLATAAHRPERT